MISVGGDFYTPEVTITDKDGGYVRYARIGGKWRGQQATHPQPTRTDKELDIIIALDTAIDDLRDMEYNIQANLSRLEDLLEEM